MAFAAPTASVLGWSINTNSLRLYYHQGECVTLHMKEGGERDELLEVVERLKRATRGCPAQELCLRRNSLGQLGFHVQPDGVVTQVEAGGPAALAGLSTAARLVEICKVAVSTLSHDQMIDLLKTSVAVTVTVIPPNPDGSIRKGCWEQACKYNSHFEGDYENINSQGTRISKTARQQPQTISARGGYERGFSPPRSSNSSGYGTGSSSKSFSHEKSACLEGGVYESCGGGVEEMRGGEVVSTCLMKAERSHQVRRSNQTIATLPVTNGGDGGDYGRCLDADDRSIGHCASDRSIGCASDRSIGHCASERSLGHCVSDTETPSPTSDRIHSQEDLSRGSSPGGLRRSKTTGCLAVRNDSPGGLTRESPRSSTVILRDSPRGGDQGSPRSSTVILRDSPRAGDQGSPLSSTVILRESPRGGDGSPRSSTVLAPRDSPRGEGSPRSSAALARDSGEARRRPASYNRNSASLSTLQQDLIRLINPDEPHQSEHPSSPSPSDDVKRLRESGRRARPSEVGKTGAPAQGNTLQNAVAQPQAQPQAQELILTMARPATVISTSSSSLAQQANSPDRNGSGRRKKVVAWPEEMDWPSLVDTATRAIMTLDSDSPHRPTTRDREEELNKQISQLEGKLSRETMRRLSLEEEVRGLREENRRLQHESQSAAQQLRRFTEWFFQTIDKQ